MGLLAQKTCEHYLKSREHENSFHPLPFKGGLNTKNIHVHEHFGVKKNCAKLISILGGGRHAET